MNNLKTPRVTVDPVVFRYYNRQLQVLLAKRTDNPERGAWSIPGGHVQVNQTLLQAIELCLAQKTGLGFRSLGYVEQLYAFDTVGLDPRGHAITIAFLCLTSRDSLKADLASAPEFFDVQKLPLLAFDHESIIKKALLTLKELCLKTTITRFVLPDNFTMSDLHNLYQVLLQRKLDRRNFRKKILSLNIVNDTGKKEQGTPNRPAQLYAFRSEKLVDLNNFIN